MTEVSAVVGTTATLSCTVDIDGDLQVHFLLSHFHYSCIQVFVLFMEFIPLLHKWLHFT